MVENSHSAPGRQVPKNRPLCRGATACEKRSSAQNQTMSHLLLSEAYLKLGDFRGAWRAAARAADLAPEQAKVHDHRPLFYIVMKAIWWLARFRSRLDHRLRAFKTKAGWWSDERRNISRDRHTS